MKLSEYLQQQNKRVNTLENNELEGLVTIARIKKLYSDLKIIHKVKVRVATYHSCGTNMICSSTLKNTSSFNEVIFY